MARGRKTGGRQKGARNRATEEARAAAAATGVLPLDYMLSVMRDNAADSKRRDAMAMAAAPYLHPRLTAIDARLSPANMEESSERPSLTLEFVLPTRDRAREDQEWGSHLENARVKGDQ
jgi:hypothetical protein